MQIKQQFHLKPESLFLCLRLSEKTNALLILFLSCLVLLISYFCLSQGITTIFMHLFYLPIILLAYKYQMKGVILSGILGAIYIVMVIFFTYPDSGIMFGAFIRWCVFLLIAIIIAIFSIYLENRQKEYETLFQSAENCILVVQRPGMQILDINTCGLTLTGYQKEEIIGKGFPNACLKQETTEGENIFNLNYNEQNDPEFHFVTKNGNEKVGHLSVGEIPNNRLVIIITDLTWGKEAEKALIASERRYRDLFNTASDQIIVHQIVSKKPGKILEANDVACDALQYSRDELRTMTVNDLLSPVSPDEDTKMIEDIKRSGHVTFEREGVRKDGTLIPIEINAHIFEDNGNMQAISIARDISERKKAENALIMINTKLNLLGSITRHDILNQLTGALGFLEILKMDTDIPPGSDSGKDLAYINEALQTIMHQILFTRDYQDLGVQSPMWFELGNLIDTTAFTIHLQSITTDNQIHNIEIYADPLFEKVISNLFDNAVRHGKTITTIRFSIKEKVNCLKVICEDDGVGVPTGVKEKIFKRQYYQHTGLGLFLSREILSITGMTITETGLPGQGARFEISVPDGMWRKK